jgi:hypothetical protein
VVPARIEREFSRRLRPFMRSASIIPGHGVASVAQYLLASIGDQTRSTRLTNRLSDRERLPAVMTPHRQAGLATRTKAQPIRVTSLRDGDCGSRRLPPCRGRTDHACSPTPPAEC